MQTTMADQSFQEIQLSGKQLFFFFMCAVVLAAVIFLLGVSVGRDFRSGPVESVQARTEPDNPAAPVPPPTQTSPNELSYAAALQGSSDTAKVTPPAPVPETPAKADAPKADAPKAVSEPSRVEPVKPAAPKTEAPKAASPKGDAKSEPTKAAAPPPPPAPKSEPPTAASADGFSLQVGAYNTEAAADSMIANLKRKGHAASLVTMPVNTDVRFRVYLGPYHSRAEAQRAQSQLQKEGFTSLIKR
jgi:cell division septation protein DedD